MHYTLRLFDSNRRPMHSLHMDCSLDESAIALVDQLALKHEMELRQGSRVVKRYGARSADARTH